jgi:hypothetical protein
MPASPTTSRLIGVFDASQRRERVIIKSSYSHRVFVFESGIVLVELAPIRDALRAGLKYLAAPAHLLGPHLKAAEQTAHQVAKSVLALSPERRLANVRLAAIEEISPDSLAVAFPGHVRGLSTTQITSASLRRIPPRELTVQYRQKVDGLATELWLRLPSAATANDAAGYMSALLKSRFRETSPMEGARSVARGLLPFRGV